ncbi:hypothetical protein EPN29_14130 [bacterium]|nr:MAG: hypothetical protein EPN29_14130 [bacterium]
MSASGPMKGKIRSPLRRTKHSGAGAEEAGEGGQERWLLTYADMITLLLVLFIVLYAISTIDQAKYQEFKQSVTRALLSQVPHGTTNLSQNSTAPQTNELTQANQQTNQLKQIEQKLTAALKSKGLLGDVTFSINSSGLVEGLVADSTFFSSDVADLTPIGMEVVDTSAGALIGFSNAIEVVGYTDNNPIIGGPYPNNWVLSAARATTVLIRMTTVDGMDPGQVALIGYGQYHPLAPNSTPAGQAQNRRVNIIISPTSTFKP